SVVKNTLLRHAQETGRVGVVVAPFDTELFGHWWFEGPRWLEGVIRGLQDEVTTTTASAFLKKHPPKSIIRLPEGSWGQGGYHWVWMNDNTKWVWQLVYQAEDAFLEVVRAARRRQAQPGVKRALAQLARELLLLESSDWPFLITTWSARDYAEARARLHVEAFETVLGIVRRATEGTMGREDEATLAQLEARDGPFPNADPAWWLGD
ncbi:MAG: DUF1957 domain-containing protein, partial [Euryarchaeota archaeon]|nr:DUF1957 domain-containing protein [Euryarchaeota archaeon]